MFNMDAALSLLVVAALALFQLPGSQSLNCGHDDDDQTFCFDYTDQTAYCCGYNDHECCYYVNYDVTTLWWFWMLLVLGIGMFFAFCVWGMWYSRRRRLERGGYIVVQRQFQYQPQPHIAVEHSNQSAQAVGPPGYSAGYQHYGAVTSTVGPPPAYGYQAPPPAHNPSHVASKSQV